MQKRKTGSMEDILSDLIDANSAEVAPVASAYTNSDYLKRRTANTEKKQKKLSRADVADQLRINKKSLLRPIQGEQLALLLANTIVFESQGTGKTLNKGIGALNLVDYYNKSYKQEDGTAIIWCYEDTYLGALKACYNILKSNKAGRSIEVTQLHQDNYNGLQCLTGIVIHVKDQVTSSTHHDLRIKIGSNNQSQRFIQLKAETKLPNTIMFK